MSVFDDEQLYLGVATGIAKYATQTDDGSSYVMSYFLTQWILVIVCELSF